MFFHDWRRRPAISIFDYRSYKSFVRDWVAARPNRGRGEYKRMAAHLRVSGTMISQVFSGDKELNLEMAAELSQFFTFDVKEERYFFLLIELGRAGSHRLKEKLNKQVSDLQTEARKISERVARHKELSSEDKAIYYSTWIHTGLRNLVAIPRVWTTPDLSSTLQIPESLVRDSLRFLTEKGLIRLTDERYEILAKATHLAADHPLVNKHHQNWRIRSFQKMDQRNSQQLFYTGPMSLSHEDAEKVRQFLVDLIQKTNRIVVDSPSETVRCLNLDWFEY